MTSISSVPSATRTITRFSPACFGAGSNDFETAFLNELAARLTEVRLLNGVSLNETPFLSPASIVLPPIVTVSFSFSPFPSRPSSSVVEVTALPFDLPLVSPPRLVELG